MFKWKLSLKGDIFAFASFSCPPVKIERDGTTDPSMERDAVFFERMALLETGIQLFESLLSSYLDDRMSGSWPKITKAMSEWLHT